MFRREWEAGKKKAGEEKEKHKPRERDTRGKRGSKKKKNESEGKQSRWETRERGERGQMQR